MRPLIVGSQVLRLDVAMSESGAGWEMHHGDCLEVMQTLDEVDHVITDPPYSEQTHQGVRSSGRDRGLVAANGKSYACNVRRTVDLGFEHVEENTIRLVAAFAAVLARRWVAIFSDLESCHMWRSHLEAQGIQYVRTVVWDRLNGAPQFTGDRPAIAVETITLAHPKGRKRWNGGGKRGIYSVPIEQNRGGNNDRLHTTQKPLDLMLGLVSDFTDPGDTILDPFAGSGTTGVACLRLGRKFIGIEKDPKYFALACDRLRAEEEGSTLHARRVGQVPLFR
jgi:DNA modification methylase